MKIGRIWEASARRLDRIDQFSFLSHRAGVIALMDLLWPNFNKKWTLLGRRCSSCQPFPFLWPRIEVLQWLDRYIATLTFRQNIFLNIQRMIQISTRSSWLNCALRDDEAVYCVSKGHYEAVAVDNWWYWVSRGHSCLYILQKVEIWTGVTDASLTHSQLWKIVLLSSL